jgi:glycine betaine monooxygenase B
MPASTLALLSSAHVALAVLRQHRSAPGLARIAFVTVSYAFAAAPWVSPSLAVASATLLIHALWLVATDRLATAAPGGRGAPSPAPRAPGGPAVAALTPSRGARARGFDPVAVLAVIDEAPDIRTFRLARPEGFGFRAGQFLPVRLRVDGAEQVRCYSISSAPYVRGYLEISVRRQGLVSNALHATLSPGATLHVRAPSGAFVYPADDDRPLVLLAGGVGVTPLRSMALEALAVDPGRPVVLVQSARQAESLPFADEFRLLARRHRNFRWVTAVTGPAAGADHYPGRIDEALLRLAAPAIAGSVVCLCGPGGMIDALGATLERMGVPADQVRYERFEAAIAAVGAKSAAETSSEAADGSGHIVTFSRSGRTLPVGRRRSLLDAAEQGGVDIPSICRAGVCGTCRTRVLEGDVRCESQTLDAEETASGYVLACVSHPVTDCTVDA